MPVDDPGVGLPVLKFISLRVPKEFLTRLEKETKDILGVVTQFVHNVLDDDAMRPDTVMFSPLLEAGIWIFTFEQEMRYEPTELEMLFVAVIDEEVVLTEIVVGAQV